MYITLLAAYIQTLVPLVIYTHIDIDFEFFFITFSASPDGLVLVSLCNGLSESLWTSTWATLCILNGDSSAVAIP